MNSIRGWSADERGAAARKPTEDIAARRRGQAAEEANLLPGGHPTYARCKRDRDQDSARVNGIVIALTYLLGSPARHAAGRGVHQGCARVAGIASRSGTVVMSGSSAGRDFEIHSRRTGARLVVQQEPGSLAVTRHRPRQARGRQGFGGPGHARAGCPESGPGRAGRAAGGLRVQQHDPGQPVFRQPALASRGERSS